MHKELGRITHATFGFGGYQDAQFGLSLQFGGQSWGCGAFLGPWAGKPSEYAKWTVESQSEQLAEAARKLEELLTSAKKKHVGELIDTPVECTFDSPCGKLVSYRILTEVL